MGQSYVVTPYYLYGVKNILYIYKKKYGNLKIGLQKIPHHR